MQLSSPRGKAHDSEPTQERLPWKLVLHFSDWPESQLVRLDAEGKVLHDAWMNSVKEADFLRNGSASAIMSLPPDESEKLWQAVENRKSSTISICNLGNLILLVDLDTYSSIERKLHPTELKPLRHVPLRIYLPDLPSASQPMSGHLKVLQSPVTPNLAHTMEPQTLGVALHALLPSLFPSRRTPVLARPVLHGAVVPMSAQLEELARCAAYLDGWIHLGIAMIN